MGNLRGHVVYGIGFTLIGLWHLINHSKLHTLNPNSYSPPPYFPTPKLKFLELHLIMAASAAAAFMDLVGGLRRHRPLAADGSIPSSHLHSFEHSVIALAFFAYALSALLLEKKTPAAAARRGLGHALAAAALAVELLAFSQHSTAGATGSPEGQYHLLLRAAVAVALAATAATLAAKPRGRGFAAAYVRAVSVILQGVWLVNMGFMLWTPRFVFKGCFMNWEKGSFVVRCEGEKALERARALVNIQFCLFVVGVNVVALVIYLVVFKMYTCGNKSGILGGGEDEFEMEIEMHK